MQMLKALDLVSDPLLLVSSNGVMNSIPSNTAKLPHLPTHRRNFQISVDKSIVCGAKKRNRYGIGRSGKRIFESAFIIASKLRLLPEPVEIILREFGGGNGGRNGFWNGFGGGGFGDWNWNKRRMKLGILGILGMCCVVGFWLGMGKELGLDFNAFLGGLGLALLGLSVKGWKRGASDWILGFCCCGFVMLVFKRDEFSTWVRSFGRAKKNGWRKLRVF